MKKINKSLPPNKLTHFEGQNPNGKWKDFYYYNAGADYNETKDLIFADQGELCAYCETSLKNHTPNKKRIEHYHSKSDKGTPGINWALDWNNVIGVCLGGSDPDPDQEPDIKERHSLPINLSCDAYKAHLENKKKLPKQCEGYVLDPLDIVAKPVLFDFDKASGELKVNSSTCVNYRPSSNNFDTVDELVINTIDVFNLNCERLKSIRLKVFHDYERTIKLARNNNNPQIKSQLAKVWFNKKWPSFFTTRRIILGDHAEQYLKTLQYNG